MQTIRLDTLEPEVVAHVLTYVQHASPISFGNAAVSCRYLCAVACDLVANHHKTIDLAEITSLKTFNEMGIKIRIWADSSTVRRNMRILTVKGESEWVEVGIPSTDAQADLFEDSIKYLLSTVGNVQLVIWRTPGFPSSQVLEAVQANHPSAKLRVLNFDYTAPSNLAEPTKHIQALAKSSALTQICCQTTPSQHNITLCVSAFRYVVSRAPALAQATLQNHYSTHVSRRDKETYEKYFCSASEPNSAVRDLTLDGYDMSNRTLREWAKYVDLTKLENIRFFRGHVHDSYFTNAPTLLPNLAHFSMNLRNCHGGQALDALQEYLENCAPLKTLSLWSWGDQIMIDTILARHGPSLISLGLHDREGRDDYPGGERTIHSVEDFEALLAQCPNLESLTFDMKRHSDEPATDGSDPNAAYFALIRDSKIDKLEIYFDAGIAYDLDLVRERAMLMAREDNDSDNEADMDISDDGDINDNGDDEADTEGEDGAAAPDEDQTIANVVDGGRIEPKPLIVPNVTPYGTYRPSTEAALEAYVKYIWTTIFGARTRGERALTIKFGEWETYHNFALRPGSGRPMDTVWLFEAREQERDDMRGVPKIYKESFQGYGLG